MALFTAESYLQMDDANLELPLFTMGEDNLRGFRKRWTRHSRSDASGQISGLPSEFSEMPEVCGLDNETERGSWVEIESYNAPSVHESAFDDKSQEGNSPAWEPEQFEVVRVAGDESTEYQWKCEAFAIFDEESETLW